ncbi:kinesin-like protein KIF6 [Gigantopelta aegis]|uniref:kinesin-like protein KIF6 n=1 Tax=Gigantopelta aegis TaxID=1735272 RepID=UPI001B887E17|nr:kinesin-like protein KIF6 [Gigantopelta aegis]
MVKQTIQIFVRIKPTRAKIGLYDVDEDEEACPRLTITVPRELASGFVNNKRENYKFRFQKVFDQKATQDEVFDSVGQPVIDNVLQGYNGTIFAYGQTSSGKTFTITGGAERYIDRGIIPRSLSYIFDKIEKTPELAFTVHISYLEIYNESGYDLLDPKHEAAKLEDLPKVSLMEDSDQNIHLKNLSVHQASSEEEALNLLFLGDTNRMIAETPMNQASTRSHCIFTIHLTARETGSATIKRAKLHLVDLAGSERVAKSGVNGILLTEAKYINLSLHYLEQVIIALAEKNRQHIPYRNSMMTSVLRDSLGGNCMTTMIATCSVDKKCIDESISTCRFAQRVALIKNDVMLNEELDPKLMIAKLKREIQQLKEELAMATGEQRTDELTEEELNRCEESVKVFVDDTDTDAVLSVGADMRKIQACFKILKRYVFEKTGGRLSESPSRDVTPVDIGPYSNTENQKLKDLVLQRDNEINILVNMLKKERAKKTSAVSQLENDAKPGVSYNSDQRLSDYTNGNSDHGDEKHKTFVKHDQRMKYESNRNTKPYVDEKTKKKILGNLSIGRQEAFDIFLADYEHNQSIEDNKRTLKFKYAEAKSLGEALNKSKNRINHFKSKIEQYRMQMAMKGLADPENEDPNEEEQELRHAMEEEKRSYKETFNKLRGMKSEIEHLQHLLEKSKVKLMKDFELWWADQSASTGNVPPSMKSVDPRTAWRTPPRTPLNNRNYSQEMVYPPSSDSSWKKMNSSRSQRSVSDNVLYEVHHHGSGETSGYSSQGSVETLHSEKPRSECGDIPLTGDAKADADIMAFVKARQNLLKQTHLAKR